MIPTRRRLRTALSSADAVQRRCQTVWSVTDGEIDVGPYIREPAGWQPLNTSVNMPTVSDSRRTARTRNVAALNHPTGDVKHL
jgi:hypothetical protein